MNSGLSETSRSMAAAARSLTVVSMEIFSPFISVQVRFCWLSSLQRKGHALLPPSPRRRDPGQARARAEQGDHPGGGASRRVQHAAGARPRAVGFDRLAAEERRLCTGACLEGL